tara:strand:+ start:9464 stop:9826 length:363 start_codon:yes stop_codon:yes gene_type:complete
MESLNKNITFKPEGWKVKTTERTKGRMKFQVKLNQEEGDAFRNFMNSVKPDHINVDEFVRSIFFSGVQTLERTLTENLVTHMEANRGEFEASGFSFDTEGKFLGVAEDEAVSDETVEVIE